MTEEENKLQITTPSKEGFLKLFFKYFYDKPSALFCCLTLWFGWTMYQDNQHFIEQQQTVLKDLVVSVGEIQKSLVELNVRVQNLERHPA